MEPSNSRKGLGRLSQGIKNAWQPLVSIAAIVLSLTSFTEAQRANELAETQLNEQRKERLEVETRELKERQQPLVSEISTDGRTITLRILSNNVSLRQVLIRFPIDLKWPWAATRMGRVQVLHAQEFERQAMEFMRRGDVNLTTVPMYVEAQFIGHGSTYSEGGIYELGLRETRIAGKSQLEFEFFEFGVPVPSGKNGEDMLAKCWQRQRAQPGYMCDKIGDLI